jgi:hypothetical protein
MGLPDIYQLQSQEGEALGWAALSTVEHSRALREVFLKEAKVEEQETVEGVPVEVVWNESFKKYQVVRILPTNTPITPHSFFYHIAMN